MLKGKSAQDKQNWKNYEDFIRKHGFKLVSIVGDGNCLFRAFSHQLEGSQENYKYYRMESVRYMQEHPEIFNNFLHDDDKYKGKLDTYIEYMSNDGIWGGNIELFALSEAFDVKIVIFHQNLTLVTIGDERRKSKTIFLAYNRSGRHYNTVIPIQPNKELLGKRVLKRVRDKKPIKDVLEIIQK